MANLFNFFSRTEIFFYALVWLMILLVAGTIEQKDVGLYQAQHKYFSSYILWLFDFIPLPSGYSVLTIIFLNLLAKLLTEKWTRDKLGNIIVHIGALTLLLGGFFTAHFSYEGNMVIPEGGEANFISDYHDVELAVLENESEVALFDATQLKEGKILKSTTMPFSIEVKFFCRNCQLIPREKEAEDPNLRAMARFIQMEKTVPFMDDETNISGVGFAVKGAGQEVDGTYSIFEGMPIPQFIRTEGGEYLVEIRHKRTYLPFSIRLLDFEKQMHPGTTVPRSYKSEVVLKDGQAYWDATIEMNEPLRYKGYTFYQSSFAEGEGGEVTVLAAVKNYGRMFPYIASIILCVGLLIHLFQRLPSLMKGRR